MVRKEWTPQEDEALINAVALYGDSKVRGVITLTTWNQSIAFHEPPMLTCGTELGECSWGSARTQVLYHDHLVHRCLYGAAFYFILFTLAAVALTMCVLHVRITLTSLTPITAPLAQSSARFGILKAA